MNRKRRRPRPLGAATTGLLVALALLHVATGTAAAADDGPMSTEDVVRMLVRGLPATEILSAIRTRPGVFDVSPDMLEELRLAGLSEELIQAMVDRMAELNPLPEPTASANDEGLAAVESAPLLRLWLDPQPEDGQPTILRLKGVVDFRLREAWQLDAAVEETPFEDLALFLVCRTATHVPDHWRSKSPLGRDFVSMPRHRMLFFLSAGEAGRTASDEISLELPSYLDLDLAAEESHDLSLGIALQVAGRYYRWTDDSWDGLLLDATGSEIRAELQSGREGRLADLKASFKRNPASVGSE